MLVRDPKLRKMLEAEADEVRRELGLLPTNSEDDEVRVGRSVLTGRLHEIQLMLESESPYHSMERRQKRHQARTWIVALLLTLLSVLAVTLSIMNRSKVHIIDQSIQRLVDQYREHGLRGEP